MTIFGRSLPSPRPVHVRLLRHTVELALAAIGIYFVSRLTNHDWSVVRHSIDHLHWPTLLAGGGAFLIYFLCRAIGWHLILRALHTELSIKKAAPIWLIAELGRYIPGNIWSFLGRTRLARHEGIDLTTTTVSLAIEMILLIVSSLVYAVLFFALPSPAVPLAVRVIGAVTTVGLLIAFFFVSPTKLMRLFGRLTRRQQLAELPISRDRLALALVPLVVGWGAYGLGSYLVVRALDISIVATATWTVSGFVVAWLIGYAAVVTPMGLGIREAIIIAILGPVTSWGGAGLTAVATRLWLTVCEVAITGVAFTTYARRVGRRLAPFFRKRFNQKWEDVGLVIAIILFLVIIGGLASYRYYNFLASRYDLGIMAQTVWNTVHGHFFDLTQPDGVATVSRFSIHGDVLLAFLAPIYWLYQSPYTLIMIQTVVVALGAVPLYWLAASVLRNRRLALLIAVTFLFSPIVDNANLYDFHPVTLVIGFLPFAFYYLHKQRYWAFLVFMVLILLTKETMAFTVIAIGLYMILDQYGWRISRLLPRPSKPNAVAVWVGAILIVISAAWFYILLWHVMPSARAAAGESGNHFALGYYSALGSTPSQILRSIFIHPGIWLHELFVEHRIWYLHYYLVPTGALVLLSPIFLLTLPELALNMFSSYSAMDTIGFQYSAAIIPLVFIALIFGARRAESLVSRLTSAHAATSRNVWLHSISRNAPRTLGIYIAIAALASFLRWSPIIRQAPTILRPAIPGASYVRQLTATVPTDASVSASSQISSHLSQRTDIFPFPQGVGTADYIIVDIHDSTFAPTDTQEAAVDKILSSGRYQLIYHNDTVYAFIKANSVALVTR